MFSKLFTTWLIVGFAVIAAMHFYLWLDKATFKTHLRFLRVGVLIYIAYMLPFFFVPHLSVWLQTGTPNVGESWPCKWIAPDGQEVAGSLTFTQVGYYTDAETKTMGVDDEGIPYPGIAGTYQYGHEKGVFSFRMVNESLFHGRFRTMGTDDVLSCTSHSLGTLRKQLHDEGAVSVKIRDTDLLMGF